MRTRPRITPALFPIGRQHVARAAAVLAAAMAGDPLNAYVFPVPARRARALAALYKLIAAFGVAAGVMVGSSPAVEAVAMWDFPGLGHRVPHGVPGSGAVRFLGVAGVPAAWRLMRYETFAHTLLVRHAPRGSAHLLLLAVHPSLQGRGWASRLVRPALLECDRLGLHCVLETQNPANVPLYEHLGFRIGVRTTVPHTGVCHWLMVRQPASGRHSVESAPA